MCGLRARIADAVRGTLPVSGMVAPIGPPVAYLALARCLRGHVMGKQ